MLSIFCFLNAEVLEQTMGMIVHHGQECNSTPGIGTNLFERDEVLDCHDLMVHEDSIIALC